MQTVEFLEYIVRLAQMRFKNEAGLSFGDKLAKTLEILFMINGSEIQIPQTQHDVSSASDYETDDWIVSTSK